MKQPLFSSTSRSRIPRREGSSATSNSSKTTTKKKKKEAREEQGNSSSSSSNRNPFHDVSNGGRFVDVSSRIGTIGSPSSLVSSIEAPRGFFLDHSAPSNCKTPKSALNSRPSSRNSEKVKGILGAYSYKRQSGKSPNPSSKVSRVDSVGNPVRQLRNSGSGDRGCCNVDELNSTPLRIIITGSGLNVATMSEGSSSLNSSNSENITKTPPLHASVSPETPQQCRSSPISTPVCYGTGHLLSGVRDRRKCKPRGLLFAGEAKPVCKFDIDDDQTNLSQSNLPLRASIHWLSPPVNKEIGWKSRLGV